MVDVHSSQQAMKMSKLKFVPYTLSFLDLSWKWLNDLEIQKLTNTPAFTKEIQIKWYESLKKKQDYQVWGIEYNSEKIGVIGLKNIKETSAECFGFIGEKKYWNLGLSKLLFDFIILYASTHGISKVWLRVIKEHASAIRAYKRYGFECDEEKNNELIMYFKVS